jgi:RNA recognition motif-containing protein
VTRTLKAAKKVKKQDRQETETERLLGKYAKKHRHKEVYSEKPAAGDISWLGKLVQGPEQTHCFVSSIAFEAPKSEVRKLFKKCGEVIAFYMPTTADSKDNNFDTIKTRLRKENAHTGKAVVMFRTLYGLRAALALNAYSLRGRELVVGRHRHKNITKAKADQKAHMVEKKQARKRKAQEIEDEAAQEMPADIDAETLVGAQMSEADRAKAWTDNIMQKTASKVAAKKSSKQKVFKKPRVQTRPAAASAAEPEDEFLKMLLEHKRKKQAKLAGGVVPKGPVGPVLPDLPKDDASTTTTTTTTNNTNNTNTPTTAEGLD